MSNSLRPEGSANKLAKVDSLVDADAVVPHIVDAPDVVLVGSGIMSSTLAVMLKRLDPRLRIQMIEVAPELAREASDGWNNAGTGHAGVCEMSYTPSRDPDGRVPIVRALRIFEQFEHSKQFWGAMSAGGVVGAPADFIHSVPHICFVKGSDDVDFLQARHAAMKDHHFFRNMHITTDSSVIEEWAPLVMEGRVSGPVAATIGDGTEVNFGLLARRLCVWLAQQDECGVATGWKVTRLRRGDGQWQIGLRCVASGEVRDQRAKFVFVGAGGGSLPLLQSTGLAEVAGLGGFPIGGQWLVCDAPAICVRHNAKVYGATPPSSPSLGSGHLDVRRLDGRRQLLFGPFASWTTRFLKLTGRWSDLPRSVHLGNLGAMLRSAVCNRALLRYLVAQGLQSMEHRVQALREYYPNARLEDWRLVQAGIRVQAIKKADRGAVYFGTEVFSPADRSLAALLGASPGASVAVNIALEVIRMCLPQLLASSEGRERMTEMIPTFNDDLTQPNNAAFYERTSRDAIERLQLQSTSY
ncbi:MAG: malate:quinone oxidoreductase [Pirellulaceae bacterium]|nr:malate:quinone oxidoreductase [Pirellulaceae bacterium]